MKFTVLRWIFLGYCTGLILANQWLPISVWLYVLPILGLLILMIYGVVNIQANFFVEAIAEGKTNDKRIALTFDDGPDEVITPQVLAMLEKHQIPATFFLIGHKIQENQDIVAEIVAKGHLVGNHSFSHTVAFDFKSSSKVQQELRATQQQIATIIGRKVRYFRPPFGITNPPIAKAVRQEKYKVIGWNVRPYDAVSTDEKIILKRIKKKLQPGSIVLLHDIKPLILNVLEDLIPYLKEQGYEVVPLDKLIQEDAYF